MEQIDIFLESLQSFFQQAQTVTGIRIISNKTAASFIVKPSQRTFLKHHIALKKQSIYIQVQKEATCTLTSMDLEQKLNIDSVEIEVFVLLEDGAKFDLFFSSISMLDVSYTIFICLQGKNSEAQLYGLYALDEKQKISLKTYQYHQGTNTKSNLVIKGMLQDQSQALYHGLIKIDDRAEQSNAAQEHKNIVLSKETKVISIPSIEVLQQDVQCYHGSAVGKFDQEHIWYLQSKGITIKSAHNLLIKSFFQDVLDGIDRQEKLEKNICQKMI